MEKPKNTIKHPKIPRNPNLEALKLEALKPETNKKNAISTHQRAPMALNEVAIIPAVTKRTEV